MKLLLIRHGDPDYEIDGLTETGKIEAELLSERIAPMAVDAYYVSPLGRARATAEPTLRKAGRTAEVCEWLKEFPLRLQRDYLQGSKLTSVCWDWLPQEWLQEKRFLDPEQWGEVEIFREHGVREEYDRIIAAFDELLAGHGYVRDGLYYRAEEPNTKTLVFFCHFGLSCVLLSHLMNVSPMVLWHGLAMAPTSVTTLNTEERRPGIAVFRASAIGDVSHLLKHGQEPSFAARFCEVYGNGDRVD